MIINRCQRDLTPCQKAAQLRRYSSLAGESCSAGGGMAKNVYPLIAGEGEQVSDLLPGNADSLVYKTFGSSIRADLVGHLELPYSPVANVYAGIGFSLVFHQFAANQAGYYDSCDKPEKFDEWPSDEANIRIMYLIS